MRMRNVARYALVRVRRAVLLGAALALAPLAAACSHDATAPAADGPTQYITVKRAWRPGERDSLIQFVLATGAWGLYSDVAPVTVPQWDSAVDLVVNPAWHDSLASAPPVQMAPAFAAGWGAAGFDIRIVFDSIPGGAVQKDSLDWLMIQWWSPTENKWHGYLVRASTAATFGYGVVNTTNFNSSNGKTGSGGGEARTRVDSATYWEANGGFWRVTANGSYGALSTIPSGPYKGGNVQTGLLTGNTWSFLPVTMPRISGTTPPTSQSISYTFTNIPVQRIFCYFTPVTPPGGYTSCTGSAAASLIALARSGRSMAMFTSGDPTTAPTGP
jgi:hypothetical protein